MSAKLRTFLGIGLFLPLAVILLATFACLPAPVGDPESAKIDESLSGFYRVTNPEDTNNDTTVMAILRPWDTHTYLLQYLQVEKKEGKSAPEMMLFKAWLTTLGDHTFITCQPMDDRKMIAGDEGAKNYWVVLRIDKTATAIEARMVSPDSEFLKDLKQRAELEAAIKAHVSDKALYADNQLICRKLGKEDQKLVEETLDKFNAK